MILIRVAHVISEVFGVAPCNREFIIIVNNVLNTESITQHKRKKEFYNTKYIKILVRNNLYFLCTHKYYVILRKSELNVLNEIYNLYRRI